MLALPSTSSASPSLQATLSKVRVGQVRRAADQAEAQAQALRSQADQAENEAQQTEVTQPTVNTPKAVEELTYTAVIKAKTPEVSPQTQDFLVRLYKATSQKFAASGNALKSNEDAPPVVNTQGQSTGRIVNTQA
jgi:di/tripeptidase